MKKGLSPIIGVVLLVVMVMVIGSMVFLWMRGSVTKAEEEALVQQECSKIDFIVDDFCYHKVLVELEGEGFEERNYIKFNGRNNAEEPELDSFLIFIDYDGRTISVPTIDQSEIEGYDARSVMTISIENIEEIKQIRIVPKIRNENTVFMCEEKEIVVQGEEVGLC